MNVKKVFLFVVLLFTSLGFAQNSASEITTKDGVRYITTSIDYPITGTYTFKGAEPVVELNGGGTGFYQQHDSPKRAMIWGIECTQTGEPKFVKGYDNKEYSLYYKFTASMESETEEEWNKVEFTIHFNSGKMFINGERMKSFTATEEKK
jgi:hypothetical protein